MRVVRWRGPASLLLSQLFTISLLVSQGTAAVYPTRFDGVSWDDGNWRIVSTIPDPGHYQSRASLANGYIGISLASLGPFFEADTPVNGDNINGWPLFDRRISFATVAGFYDSQPTTNGTNFAWLNQYGGESIISGLPHWSGLVVSHGDCTLDAYTDVSQISGFVSTMDMAVGTMSWRFTWTPPKGPAMDVEYNMFAHKLHVNQAAVQLKITSSRNTNVTVADVLDGGCALRTDFEDKGYEQETPTIWSAVRPLNIANVTGFVYSTMAGDSSVDMESRTRVSMGNYLGGNMSSIAQSVVVDLVAGQTSTVSKFVGIASTDAFDDPQGTARQASAAGASAGYVESLQSHIGEWQGLFTFESVDRYNQPDGSLPDDSNVIEQNVLAVANPYYLLQNTVGANAIAAANNSRPLDVNSISVGGLYSDSYGGMIFWDSDVWMGPGLLVAHPQASSQIINYRRAKYPQALRNAQTAHQSSKNDTSISQDAAAYSWTSGRYGNCTGTGPCWDYEYHLNGDIALELKDFISVTGDIQTFKEQYWPIFNSIAQLYSDILAYKEKTDSYTLLNATDPDEYANEIDSPGFTLPLMRTILKNANFFRNYLGMDPVEQWETQASKIFPAIDEKANIILEYLGMNGSVQVKQADVVLIDDFLSYDYPNNYTLSNLEFYAGRQSLSGPAMTYGVFSIVASLFAPSGCAAYTYDLYGSQPYTRGPFFQFSEQLVDDFIANDGTHPAFPFLTGHGGANRVAVFGYLGLRLNTETFNIDPSLPPQIRNLKYRTIYWQGHPIEAIANSTHTTITRPSTIQPLARANAGYVNAPIPVRIGYDETVYRLSPQSSLTFANRQPGLNLTQPTNLAQCRPVANASADYLPGQFPLSAVDGYAPTKWQPALSASTSNLTIDLGSNSTGRIAGFYFDFAQAPPREVYVGFANSTAPEATLRDATAGFVPVGITAPYDASAAQEVLPYAANTTRVTLEAPVWGGRFVTLSIRGSWADMIGNGTGATVGEFAVFPVAGS